MSNKKKIISLFILSVISIILLILSIMYINSDKSKEKVLEVEINKEEVILDTIDMIINPGEEIKYKVVTNSNNEVKSKVEIWFVGVHKDLKGILNIYIQYDGNVTKKESITTYTPTNKLIFDKNLNKNDNYFDLIFEMPSNVGNNSQNKNYDFETHIKVKI